MIAINQYNNHIIIYQIYILNAYNVQANHMLLKVFILKNKLVNAKTIINTINIIINVI